MPFLTGFVPSHVVAKHTRLIDASTAVALLPPRTRIAPLQAMSSYQISDLPSQEGAWSSLMSSSTCSMVRSHSTAPGFEPLVNVPALVSFLVIFAMFAFLQTRIVAVADAGEAQREALRALRDIKSKELAVVDGSDKPTAGQVEAAVEAYRLAVQKEEELRTLAPGVRIPSPTSSTQQTEDRAAAQRFLGVQVDATMDESKKTPGPLSPVAVGVLASVAVSQLLLLGLLAVDRPSL